MVTRRTQKSCYFDDETIEAVQDLADSDNRSFAYMIEVLVKEALATRGVNENKRTS